MKIFSLIMTGLLLFSCNDKKIKAQTTQKSTQNTAENPVKHYTAPPVYIDSAASEKQILDHLAKRRQDLEGLLKTATPEQADKFYEDYQKENDSAVFILMGRKSKLLDEYASFFTYNEKTGENPLIIPKGRQSEIKNIENTGVEFWYVGEGYTELRMKPDFYYTMFKGKVSPDYQRWLELLKEEDKELYAADAGIIVPWDNIAARILAREKFLKDFPDSKLTPVIKGQLKYYRFDYFLGEDNTPVFPGVDEYADKMDPDIYKEYLRFMKANPTSETTKLLKELLKEPTQAIWRDNLNRILGERYE